MPAFAIVLLTPKSMSFRVLRSCKRPASQQSDEGEWGCEGGEGGQNLGKLQVVGLDVTVQDLEQDVKD